MKQYKTMSSLYFAVAAICNTVFFLNIVNIIIFIKQYNVRNTNSALFSQ